MWGLYKNIHLFKVPIEIKQLSNYSIPDELHSYLIQKIKIQRILCNPIFFIISTILFLHITHSKSDRR